LQARKGDRGGEGTEHTRDAELWGMYNTPRYARSRSTRRDTLPHSLRFVRHKPWLFRFGALRLLCGLVVILSVGYSSVILSFLPICLLLVMLVRWLVLSVYINAMEDNAEVRPHPTVRCHPPRASAHSSRLARKPGSQSPALAYVPERSWLRWHPHEATVAQTARGYSFTP
jgi:hypothetical protein